MNCFYVTVFSESGTRCRHSVWIHFEIVRIFPKRVKCKVAGCGTEMCGTTTVAMNHLSRSHENIFSLVCEEERSRRELPNEVVPGRSYSSLQDRYMDHPAMWVINSPTIPMSVVENPWFIKKEKLLRESIIVPCRQTLDRRMDEIYERLRGLVKEQLAEAEKISISLDIWTQKNFLSS